MNGRGEEEAAAFDVDDQYPKRGIYGRRALEEVSTSILSPLLLRPFSEKNHFQMDREANRAKI